MSLKTLQKYPKLLGFAHITRPTKIDIHWIYFWEIFDISLEIFGDIWRGLDLFKSFREFRGYLGGFQRNL